MKNKKVLLIIALFIGMINFAQEFQGFNYKALLTQNANPMANQNIDVKFSIRSYAVMPSIDNLVWQEEHTNVQTDANGIFSVVIGTGNKVGGSAASFKDIEWWTVITNMQLKVEIDTGSGYQVFQPYKSMQAVPFAKEAFKATKLEDQNGQIVFTDSSNGIKFNANNNGSNRYELHLDGLNGLSFFYNNTPIMSMLGAGTVTFSTDIIGENLNLSGKIKNSESGDADMKAYLYGSVSSNGTLQSNGSTDGFTVTKTGTGEYKITFNTSFTLYSEYIAFATIRFGSVGFISTDKYAGYLKVKTYDTSGTAADRPFDFLIFKK
jgi:hypothetical protein